MRKFNFNNFMLCMLGFFWIVLAWYGAYYSDVDTKIVVIRATIGILLLMCVNRNFILDEIKAMK